MNKDKTKRAIFKKNIFITHESRQRCAELNGTELVKHTEHNLAHVLPVFPLSKLHCDKGVVKFFLKHFYDA
jgi:hypothetical protein